MSSPIAGAGPSSPAASPDRPHFVTVGWGPRLVERLLDEVERRGICRFSHILMTPGERDELAAAGARDRVYALREAGEPLPAPDHALLASLERHSVPTIHNMILSDRVVGGLDYRDAAAYATFLAKRLTDLFRRIGPSAVIGGFDSLHGGIGLAVARSLDLPWFALHASTIPMGLCCFCRGLTPDTAVVMQPPDSAALRRTAEEALDGFTTRRVAVPAYSSANTTSMILKRLPKHLAAFRRVAGATAAGRFDRYTEYSLARVCRQYVRKRRNVYALPAGWFVTEPPPGPFLFFGLQMQPESSIDVWAPFFSNQLQVVETIARAMPASHQLLVKVHRSDADNYSRADLDRFRRLPGVTLVSPFAQSRAFIDRAAAIVAIQGTIALEAALVGKPVVMFGETRLTEFPTVARVQALPDLPALVRRALAAPPPDRESIVRGLMSYLTPFVPGFYNDFESDPKADEVDNMTDMFSQLGAFLRVAGP